MGRKRSDWGLYKRGDIWWASFTDENGRRVRRSTGTKNKTLARQILNKWRTEVVDHRYLDKKAVSKTTFFQHVQDYWKLEGQYRKAKSLKQKVQFWKERMGDVPLVKITQQKIEAILSKAKTERNWSDATWNRYRALISTILSKAVEWGHLDKNPAAKVRSFKEDNQRARFLSGEEGRRLIDACSDDLKPIVIIAIHTGMRRGEILGLLWNDVDLKNGTIFVRKSKSGKGRHVTMNSTVRKTLMALPKDTSRGLVFPSRRTGGVRPDVKKPLAAALKKAGVEDFRFHDLRHTFGSYLTMEGADPRTLQTEMGHSSLRMTERYAHLAPQHRKEVVKRLDGLFDISTGTRTGTEGD